MSRNLFIPALVVFTSLLFAACLKDTDFDQASEVTLTPVIELDLIYFNIEAGAFYDQTTATPILTVTDTTEIRFLDDSEIQESLKGADFYFKFTNSIDREFQVDFQFLSEQNDTTYATQTTVNNGTTSNPVITEFTEIIEEEEIVQLTMANRVVVSVTIPSSNASLEGELNLQSKTTYYLEIKEQ